MGWRRVEDNPDMSPEERAPFKVRTKIVVDESLGREVANVLRQLGVNVVFGPDVGLRGKSDEDVFAYAWREKRMLWTHDNDFLDDRRFPEHRNPGVVVLPGGDGNQEAMETGMRVAVSTFRSWPSGWLKSKSSITPTGEMTMRRRMPSGKTATNRFRHNRDGSLDIWEDD
jgi:predicted nuclease of predicted toxin-antitoxin system